MKNIHIRKFIIDLSEYFLPGYLIIFKEASLLFKINYSNSDYAYLKNSKSQPNILDVCCPK